jgi:hypothetical protein
MRPVWPPRLIDVQNSDDDQDRSFGTASAVRVGQAAEFWSNSRAADELRPASRLLKIEV